VDALEKLDISAFTFHKKSVEDVLQELQTSLDTGLTQKEAEARLAKYGHNELEKEEEESIWEKIKEQFEDLLVRILLFAAFISFLIAVTGKHYQYVSKSLNECNVLNQRYSL
jgi:P-type Ca2+ transporter type 2C